MVGCAKREGRGKRGAWAAPAGVLGGRPRGEPLCLPSGPQRPPLPQLMRFMLLFSRQGKLRLQKWYLATSDKERKKMVRELMQVVLARKPKMCSFLEWRDLKVVYKRYASLYFCCAIEGQDNELITLELIHRYVELLDKYFGSVCELDIIFNFEKAYFILDEFLMGGDVQDTSKKSVLKAIEQADLLQEEDESPRSVLEEMGLA
ncbi:AP-1 complex subunit sigma-1A isoform X3 [Macaca fascicularis]